MRGVRAVLLLAAFVGAGPVAGAARAEEAVVAPSGSYAADAAAAEAILADPSRAGEHAAAWTRLGDALHAGGWRYAALVAWAEALRLDPMAAAGSYPVILDVADALDEELWIGELVGRDFAVPMDPETRARVAYVAARAHFAAGRWGDVLGLLPLVPERSPLHLDAEVLRGVTLAQQGRHGEALVPLLTSYEAARQAGRDQHFVATLALNIARTFFATGNYGRAMEYFDKVPRSDAFWPQAHFERAWAHFRAGDLQGTIALLQTHRSPFFADWYFPEAEMLRAQALYLMCKYPETVKAIDAFTVRYEPMQATLAKVAKDVGPRQAFEGVRTWLADGPTPLPEPLLQRLRYDQRFLDAAAALDAADRELARLPRTSWGERAAVKLKARADERTQIEGRRVLARVQDAREELAGMLADLQLAKVDLLSHEARLYERAAVTGELETERERIGKIRELRRKGKRVWPFEGEFWADELGWYRVTARSDCPASSQGGQDTE